MTAKQRREHKIGNQVRKAVILKLARTGAPQSRGYFARYPKVQNGKYTALVERAQREPA